jgi:molybdopterin molybdotransferase
MLAWEDARRIVVEEVGRRPAERVVCEVGLGAARGRVLAEDARIDRDLPPFDRVTRDGFALRAADVASVPATLRVLGEVKAGEAFGSRVGAGEAVEIYTGAPLPQGADAVVMVEDTRRAEGGAGATSVTVLRTLAPGDNFVPRGAEGVAGTLALAAGARLDPPQLALLASLGVARPRVFAAPRVAVLSTGDEIVPVEATPGPTQIRNSNAVSLAAQVERAGGHVVLAERVGDEASALRAAVERALAAEARVLVFSGGVSMGKYDLVEDVLAGLGARQIWNGVAIRPGKPVVFGEVANRFFFGLPGNPLSTMVTFELFARPALEHLGGATVSPTLPPVRVRLAAAAGGKALPLALFVPVTLTADGALPLVSQGSGDLVGMARADGWVIVPPDAGRVAAGADLAFLPR